jgi:hypothetical protein
MRTLKHVDQNLASSDAPPLAPELLQSLRAHRWERDWRVP